MSHWPQFSLSLLGMREILLFLPFAVGLVLFIYARTNPTPRTAVMRLLSGCRGLVILLILMMLAEPAVQFIETDIVKPPMVLLLDTSKSMEMEADGVSRLDEVRAVTRSVDFGSVMDRVDVVAFGFADQAYPLGVGDIDTTLPSGRATNISSALRRSIAAASDRGSSLSVLMMTDGGHNLGDDPVDVARDLGVPIFTLQAGRVAAMAADAQVVDIKAPEVGYVGQHMSIQATVQSWGYSGRPVEVVLYQGDKVVARLPLVHGEDGEHQTVSFEVEPDESGPQLFRVVIPAIAGDRNVDNNESLAFVRILEHKVETLIIAGGPSADLAFARRSLDADSTMAVRTLTQRNNDTFYEIDASPDIEISGVDVFVLIDPGEEVMGERFGGAIRRRVLAGAGLLFVGGQRSFADWEQSSPIVQLLPVESPYPQPKFVVETVTTRMSEHGRVHPVTRSWSADNQMDPWAQLPPLLGYFPLSRMKAGAIALIESNTKVSTPIVSVTARERGRVVAVASGDLWRMDLISSGADDNLRTVRDFWSNAVKWLASESRSGRVRVSGERKVYKGGEEVVLLGHVLDELLRPLVGADLQVVLEDSDNRIQMLEADPGSYRGVWRGLDPGTYSFVAKAVVDEAVIGEDRGSFIVEQHSVESTSVRPNGSLLSEIARVSGGRTGSVEDWRSLVESMPLQRRLTETNTTLSVWDQQWLVAAAILLLTLEWYIRKQQGMV